MKKICFLVCLTFVSAAAHPVRPRHDLIDIKTVNPNIQVHLYFASTDNITKKAFYSETVPAYFRGEVTAALSNIQKELEAVGLGLLIVDAYRPASLQKEIYNSCTHRMRVTNPDQFMRHASGMAVDALLINLSDMSIVCIPFAYCGDLVPPQSFDVQCSPDDQAKYATLKTIMEKHGFRGQAPHFDFMRTRRVCRPLALSFEELAKK